MLQKNSTQQKLFTWKAQPCFAMKQQTIFKKKQQHILQLCIYTHLNKTKFCFSSQPLNAESSLPNCMSQYTSTRVESCNRDVQCFTVKPQQCTFTAVNSSSRGFLFTVLSTVLKCLWIKTIKTILVQNFSWHKHTLKCTQVMVCIALQLIISSSL